MSPIRASQKLRYPKDWPAISLAIRQDRAGWRCECRGECKSYRHAYQPEGERCPNVHGQPSVWTGSTVVLTTAHLNHAPEDCRPENLLAMCQGCHLAYDREHHKTTKLRGEPVRTQDEIAARLRLRNPEDDPMGWQAETLLPMLDWTHAEEFANGDLWDAQKWAVDLAAPRDPKEEGLMYAVFAIGKIVDHRGISAARSVTKLTEFAWLIGNDALFDMMQEMAGRNEYAQYGAPIVKCFVEGVDDPKVWATWAEHQDILNRMAMGEPCRDGCMDGCGT